MLAFLLDRRENEEGLFKLTAAFALPHAGEKKGSSIAEKKTTAVQKFAHFAFYIVICHGTSPYPATEGSSTHSRQVQTSTKGLTLF